MARYNFVSPGAAATNAIDQLLSRRLAEQLEQQQVEQSITSQQAAIRQRDDEIRRREDEDRINAVLRQQAMAQQAEQQQAALMDKADARAMDFMRFDADRMSREAQAEANRVAQAERNDADNKAAAERAQLMRSVQNSNADLQREIMQGRIDRQAADTAAVKEKTDIARAARDNARSQALSSTQGTLSLIDKFIDEQGALRPEAGKLFGLRVPQFLADSLPLGQTTNLSADLNRLASEQIVGLIDEMKRQSQTGATGFGALNLSELDILRKSATTLSNRNISDQAAAAELKRLRDKVTEIQARVTSGGPSMALTPPDQPPAVTMPSAPKRRYDINGNLIP